jgi:hypothetical protein
LFTAPAVFSADSKFFFTFSNAIRVHDTKTGELVRILRGHTDLVTSVLPSPDPQSYQVRQEKKKSFQKEGCPHRADPHALSHTRTRTHADPLGKS